MSTRTGKGKKRKRIGKRRDVAQSRQFIKAAKEHAARGDVDF